MPNLNDVRITYIGGPTILLEVEGIRLLTDPTFDPPRDYQTGPFIHSKTVGPAFPMDTIGEFDASRKRICRRHLQMNRQVAYSSIQVMALQPA